MPHPSTTLPPWAYNNTIIPPWVNPQATPTMGAAPRRPIVSQNIVPPAVRTPNPSTGGGSSGGIRMGGTGGGAGATWIGRPNIPKPPVAPAMRPPVQTPIDHNYNNIMQELVRSTQSASNQGTNDYSDIMSKLTGALGQAPSTYTPYTPTEETFNFEGGTDSVYNPYTSTDQVYSESPGANKAFGMMDSLAETGGYSEGDLANLRARGVSPIRAVYANAMQSLDRNKALQGGYGPGHAAATTRMSRDLSEQISGATTNVNAKIAEMVASGKQAAIPQLLAARQQENEYKNAITGRNTDARNRAGEVNAAGMADNDRANKDRLMKLIDQKQGVSGRNADARNKANEFNNKMKLDTETSNKNRDVEIMSQMRSLYGTTPGLADTFSKNALSTAELAAKLKQMKSSGQLSERELEQKGGMGLIDAFIRSLGR